MVRGVHTLVEGEAASVLMIDYLRDCPDDDGLRDADSGLYIKMAALQQTVVTTDVVEAHAMWG